MIIAKGAEWLLLCYVAFRFHDFRCIIRKTKHRVCDCCIFRINGLEVFVYFNGNV